MKRRHLGTGGPQIGAVALGTMNFCGTYTETDDATSLDCMARSLDIGIDHFDTSNVYGAGQAEELLSRFLKGNRNRVTLASKVGITRNADKPFDNEASYIRTCLEDSLKRLGTDHIELYYIHRREQERPIEDVIETMARLVEEGKIGAIGLSEVAPTSLERAAAVHPIAAVQSEYSLWTRQPELGMLQACARNGTAFVAFSCMGRGILSGTAPHPRTFREGDFRQNMPRFSVENFDRNIARLQPFFEFCRTLGYPPAAVAIAWVLAQGPHVIALPGSRSADHMAANAMGGDLSLSKTDLAQIEELLPVGWAHGARYPQAPGTGPESYC